MRRKKKHEQPKLFDDAPEPPKIRDDFPVTKQPHARNTDPETSHNWAKYLNVEHLAAKCILCLYQHGAMHAYRCAELIDVTIANVSRMFTTLYDDKLVDRIGRDENKNVSELTDLGRKFAIKLLHLEERR